MLIFDEDKKKFKNICVTSKIVIEHKVTPRLKIKKQNKEKTTTTKRVLLFALLI